MDQCDAIENDYSTRVDQCEAIENDYSTRCKKAYRIVGSFLGMCEGKRTRRGVGLGQVSTFPHDFCLSRVPMLPLPSRCSVSMLYNMPPPPLRSALLSPHDLSLTKRTDPRSAMSRRNLRRLQVLRISRIETEKKGSRLLGFTRHIRQLPAIERRSW